jgi:4-hydroxybenzoate polyprenyltransferase
MDVKQVLSFIKIEHTLFSLPFVLIGYILAHNEFVATDASGVFSWIAADLLWILLAAIGARGLAMGLNRIIDRKVDADNPRTAGRHLASGSMSMRTAWSLCGVFLVMLLGSAAMLNQVALLMAWLPRVRICRLSIPQAVHMALPFLAWPLPRACPCRRMGGDRS